MPLVSFYALRKDHKTYSFMMFSGGIERDQWNEMGLIGPVIELTLMK